MSVKVEIDADVKYFISKMKGWRGAFPKSDTLRWHVISLTGEEFEMLMMNGVEIRQISREDIANS